MDLNLKGKKVFVTASSGGIGLAIAKGFLQEGAHVAINGRDINRLHEVREELAGVYGHDIVVSVCGDASLTDSIKRFTSELDREWSSIDILICNTGYGKGGSGTRYDIEEWRHLYDLNLFGNVQLIKCFRRMLKKGNDPSVVMISSLAAFDCIGAPPAYAAAKAGVNSIVKYLSDDFADVGIRVNGVAPGNIYFKGGRWEELFNEDRIGVEKYINENVPMKRFGNPKEIADAVLFLASQRASFITGTVLKVDGGQSRGY